MSIIVEIVLCALGIILVGSAVTFIALAFAGLISIPIFMVGELFGLTPRDEVKALYLKRLRSIHGKLFLMAIYSVTISIVIALIFQYFYPGSSLGMFNLLERFQ